MTLRRVMLIAAALCLLASLNAAQTKPAQDVWEPLKVFVGE